MISSLRTRAREGNEALSISSGDRPRGRAGLAEASWARVRGAPIGDPGIIISAKTFWSKEAEGSRECLQGSFRSLPDPLRDRRQEEADRRIKGGPKVRNNLQMGLSGVKKSDRP